MTSPMLGWLLSPCNMLTSSTFSRPRTMSLTSCKKSSNCFCVTYSALTCFTFSLQSLSFSSMNSRPPSFLSTLPCRRYQMHRNRPFACSSDHQIVWWTSWWWPCSAARCRSWPIDSFSSSSSDVYGKKWRRRQLWWAEQRNHLESVIVDVILSVSQVIPAIIPPTETPSHRGAAAPLDTDPTGSMRL